MQCIMEKERVQLSVPLMQCIMEKEQCIMEERVQLSVPLMQCIMEKERVRTSHGFVHLSVPLMQCIMEKERAQLSVPVKAVYNAEGAGPYKPWVCPALCTSESSV